MDHVKVTPKEPKERDKKQKAKRGALYHQCTPTTTPPLRSLHSSAPDDDDDDDDPNLAKASAPARVCVLRGEKERNKM